MHATDGIMRTWLDRQVAKVGDWVAWIILASMAISVFEVFSRYLFNSPTSWVHETVVFLVSIAFCIGGPVALARDKHIRVRMIYDMLPPEKRNYLDIVNTLIALLFCVGFTYASYLMMLKSVFNPAGDIYLARSGTYWNPPFPAYVKMIIFGTLCVMTLQSIMHLIYFLRGGDARFLNKEESK
ncbi:TRAP transporter small permease [Rhodobacteraceae bacterium RKSG542]|nr:TRAP transporter small permease [Pseudovibrio flavus]